MDQNELQEKVSRATGMTVEELPLSYGVPPVVSHTVANSFAVSEHMSDAAIRRRAVACMEEIKTFLDEEIAEIRRVGAEAEKAEVAHAG